ncbi:MAG: phosphate signaling complex protein PhoU [Catenisphaera adipataccumulans]|jgi:phosphate transport system protein|uniref:phosphate signaling complex protein PhoU n=1 Tax=Catenisphaera adipataccumulans TaxID=700500 RepID=UPI003D8D4D77
MRDAYQRELLKLHDSLIEMGNTCEKIIHETYQALIQNDTDILEDIERLESSINRQERQIERDCMNLLLLQQPVATDLREVSSALKMITDLERIGDQAFDIADIIRKHPNLSEDVKKVPMQEMAQVTMEMVHESVMSYVKSDLAQAKKVLGMDDKVDELFEVIHRSVKANIEQETALEILMIAKYYERIGDHATNVAEWVEYSITGEH